MHTFNPNASEHDGRFVAAKDEIQKSNIEFYLCESKLIRFVTHAWAEGMNVPPIVWDLMPSVDFNRSWTDKELFEHFNFDSEEIEYINGIIK